MTTQPMTTYISPASPSGIIRVRIAYSRGFQTSYKYIEEETLFTFDKIYKRQFKVFDYHYNGDPSVSGVSATPPKWTQIYPIEDFIPKVTDEVGEIPKFKEDGTLESSGFTIESSVPSNAVFTDTTYNNATTSTAGLMSASDKTKINNLDNVYLKKTDLVILTEQQYEDTNLRDKFLYLIKEGA